MQQQQEQAEQLKILQEQLTLLQQQLSSGTPVTVPARAATRPTLPPSYAAVTPKLPAYNNAEISELADSASTYLAAFSNLAAGRFAPAEAGFNIFLQEYPEHQYAPNARYWLANAQAAQNNLPAAISNLRQLVVADNAQSKTPAAMVLLAQIYRQQKLHNEADEILEQLRSRYPDSPEAQHFYQSEKPR
jgi:tol-pal system protein YbgF